MTQAQKFQRTPAFVELRRSLASSIEEISPFIDQLMMCVRRLMNRFHNVGDEMDLIELALREAVGNAVIHGNGQNRNKRTYVTCRCDLDGAVSLTVADEGRGFDPRTVADPTHTENLRRSHGRGILFMRAFMDEVSFENGGTVVRMRKRLCSTSR